MRRHVYNDDPRPPRPAFRGPEQWTDLALFAGEPVEATPFAAYVRRLQDSPDPTERVLAVLLDGRPHTVAELRAAGGASGDRRGRDLRDCGLTITKQRDPQQPNGPWLYALVLPARSALDAAIETIARRRRERFEQRRSA